MRALWTQIPRPKLRGSSSLSSADALTSVLVRKTTTKPLKRRVGFHDAFTVLLCPVLAAALIVDTSWKAKQRKVWDEKLSAINEEIEQLHERERERTRQASRSFQLRAIHNGRSHQRREYTTAVHALEESDELDSEIEMPSWEDEEFGTTQQAKHPLQSHTVEELSSEQMSKFHRYHRLNAIELALRLLIHLRIGPSPYFSLSSDDDPAHKLTLDMPDDTNHLAKMLELTRAQIRSSVDRDELIKAAPRIEAKARQGTLHRTVKELTAEFDKGNVSIPGLVNGFSKALMQTDAIPSVGVYIMLIRSLSKIGSQSLTYLTAAALRNSTLPLSDEAMLHILFQIGKAGDSRSLNHILHLVARSDNRINLTTKWERYYVNGLDLPVPTSMKARLLQILIYTALRCEQPERAEAWLSLIQEADYGRIWRDDLFRAFLGYYSFHGNWDQGKKWLQLSITYADTIAARSIDRFARVIYRMLDLCVRCRKLPEYTTILDAAVKSGIGPPLIDRSPNDHRGFHPRVQSILLEWESLLQPEGSEESSVEEKARCFQEACQSLVQERFAVPPRNEQLSDNVSHKVVHMSPRDSIQYSVHNQKELYPSKTCNTDQSILAEIREMQTKYAQQDDLIASLRAQLNAAERRREAFEEQKAAWTDQWRKNVYEAQKELQDARAAAKALQGMNEQYTREQLALRKEISDLRTMTEEFKQQSKQSEVQQEISDLKQLARQLMQQSQARKQPQQQQLNRTAAQVDPQAAQSDVLEEDPEQISIRTRYLLRDFRALDQDRLDKRRGIFRVDIPEHDRPPMDRAFKQTLVGKA